ncbi:MAG: hypothetical protein PHR25_07100, partial [Clostridia bacterium]|nr:hypothetical protein [Clostridia bacterium]
MKKSVFLITILLSLLITTKVKALNSININDVQMECIYTGGTSIIYDGSEMYISDSASESDNANTSIPTTNKYLLGSTKFLKNVIFSAGYSGFKCPDKLASAKVLNNFESGEENKSYSEYFFSHNGSTIDYYKYIIFFSLDQINKVDDNKITINNNSVKVDTETYSGGKPLKEFGETALTRNKAVAGGDKPYMTLEDIYGVGYAVKARTEKTGWWFFGNDEGETYVNSIQKMVDITKISNTRKLINEKVFVSNYVDPAIECNYMTESSQVISTNLFITVNIYPDEMILIEGNYGTTTSRATAFDSAKRKAAKTTEKLVNPKDCPSVVYSKFPTSRVEYGKTNPTISYENIRYDVIKNKTSGYIKMSLLPEG